MAKFYYMLVFVSAFQKKPQPQLFKHSRLADLNIFAFLESKFSLSTNLLDYSTVDHLSLSIFTDKISSVFFVLSVMVLPYSRGRHGNLSITVT